MSAAFTPNVGGFALPNQPRPQAPASPPPMTAAFTPGIGGFALPPQGGMQGGAASMTDVLAQMVQQHSQAPPQPMQAFSRPAMAPNLDKPLPPLPPGSRPLAAPGQGRPNLDKPLPSLPQSRPNFDKPLPALPQSRPQPGLSSSGRADLNKPLPSLPQSRPQISTTPSSRPSIPMQARPSMSSAAPTRPSFQASPQAAAGSARPQPSAQPKASTQAPPSATPQASVQAEVSTQSEVSSQPEVPTQPQVSTPASDVDSFIAESSKALERAKANLGPSAGQIENERRLAESAAFLEAEAKPKQEGEFSSRQMEALRGELSTETVQSLKSDMWLNEAKSGMSSTTREEARELSLARDKINAELGERMNEDKLEAAGQRFIAEGAPMHKTLVLELLELVEEEAEDTSLSSEVRDERAAFAQKLQHALDTAAQAVKK
jgi:hypothetical protein